MEERLTALFDYQKFQKNEKLQALIDETEARYRKRNSERRAGFSVVKNGKKKEDMALSDDDLTMLNAAKGEYSNTNVTGVIKPPR